VKFIGPFISVAKTGWSLSTRFPYLLKIRDKFNLLPEHRQDIYSDIYSNTIVKYENSNRPGIIRRRDLIQKFFSRNEIKNILRKYLPYQEGELIFEDIKDFLDWNIIGDEVKFNSSLKREITYFIGHFDESVNQATTPTLKMQNRELSIIRKEIEKIAQENSKNSKKEIQSINFIRICIHKKSEIHWQESTGASSFNYPFNFPCKQYIYLKDLIEGSVDLCFDVTLVNSSDIAMAPKAIGVEIVSLAHIMYSFGGGKNKAIKINIDEKIVIDLPNFFEELSGQYPRSTDPNPIILNKRIKAKENDFICVVPSGSPVRYEILIPQYSKRVLNNSVIRFWYETQEDIYYSHYIYVLTVPVF
jgi:hypothetical protein